MTPTVAQTGLSCAMCSSQQDTAMWIVDFSTSFAVDLAQIPLPLCGRCELAARSFCASLNRRAPYALSVLAVPPFAASRTVARPTSPVAEVAASSSPGTRAKRNRQPS